MQHTETLNKLFWIIVSVIIWLLIISCDCDRSNLLRHIHNTIYDVYIKLITEKSYHTIKYSSLNEVRTK